MDRTETSQLLTIIAAVDNRDVTELTVAAWYEILRDVPYPVARRANVIARQDESIRYLEPKHIYAISQRIMREARHAVRQEFYKAATSALGDRIWESQFEDLRAGAWSMPDPPNMAALVTAYVSENRAAFDLEVAQYMRQIAA